VVRDKKLIITPTVTATINEYICRERYEIITPVTAMTSTDVIREALLTNRTVTYVMKAQINCSSEEICMGVYTLEYDSITKMVTQVLRQCIV
jgi:hypothetical protein